MTDAMEKVGAGRPKIDSQAALRDVLGDPAKREVFIECVERLVRSKEAAQVKVDLHSDDVKSTAETYKMAKAFLNGIVNTLVKDDVVEVIEGLSDKSDVLELFIDRQNP